MTFRPRPLRTEGARGGLPGGLPGPLAGPLPGPSAQCSTLIRLGSYIWPWRDNRVTHGRHGPGWEVEELLHWKCRGFLFQAGSRL